jgi:hypothetical protein
MSEPLPLSQQKQHALKFINTLGPQQTPPFGFVGQVDRLRRDVVKGRLLESWLRRRLRHNLLLLQNGKALAQAQNGGLRGRLQQQQLRVQVAHVCVCKSNFAYYHNNFTEKKTWLNRQRGRGMSI